MATESQRQEDFSGTIVFWQKGLFGIEPDKMKCSKAKCKAQYVSPKAAEAAQNGGGCTVLRSSQWERHPRLWLTINQGWVNGRSNARGSKLAKDSMIRAEFVDGEGSRKSSGLHSLNKHVPSPMLETRVRMTYSHVPPRPQNCPQEHR